MIIVSIYFIVIVSDVGLITFPVLVHQPPMGYSLIFDRGRRPLSWVGRFFLDNPVINTAECTNHVTSFALIISIRHLKWTKQLSYCSYAVSIVFETKLIP